MRLYRRHIRLLLALLLIAGWAIWQSYQTAGTGVNKRPAVAEDIDYFIRGATLHQYNASGQRVQTLETDQLDHYPTQQLSKLQAPSWWSINESGEVTSGESLQGTAHDDNDLLVLIGKVKVQQQSPAGQARQLNSEKLNLYRLQNTLDTDLPVTMRDNFDTVINGVGMQADMNKGTLVLNSRVKGRYHGKPDNP